MSEYEYSGKELDLFAGATCWKSYCRARLSRYIAGDVLEVGAGIGGTTRVLCDGTQRSWTCLEPDHHLAKTLSASLKARPLALVPEIHAGTLSSLTRDRLFDTILYIDVLEHIEDDRAELVRAGQHLREGGHLVVLCPAHNFLFTDFDRAIGHFRRYDRAMFRGVSPLELHLRELYYLDSAGMILSWGNRLLLRSSQPTQAQIRLWDRVFVRCSRLLDPLFGWRLGKTIVAVWSRPQGPVVPLPAMIDSGWSDQR